MRIVIDASPDGDVELVTQDLPMYIYWKEKICLYVIFVSLFLGCKTLY